MDLFGIHINSNSVLRIYYKVYGSKLDTRVNLSFLTNTFFLADAASLIKISNNIEELFLIPVKLYSYTAPFVLPNIYYEVRADYARLLLSQHFLV